jgi:hypothetical protein
LTNADKGIILNITNGEPAWKIFYKTLLLKPTH